MIYKEVVRDLFSVPQGYYLAHCISADYALGAGIAKIFNEVYNMRHKLHRDYGQFDGDEAVGHALLVENVFNLVTKEGCYMKPTYDTLREALIDMKEQCEEMELLRVAMPLIGCGLDGLEWDKVKEIIKETFDNTDIKILICKL